MSCTDFHLRNLIKAAAEQRSHELLDDAFAIIQEHFDCFIDEFSPELLVLFAEVAIDLCEREDAVIQALELYDRLACEDDQFKQLQFAISFLMKGLAIATRLSDRYGFLVYNASLVFWTVIRPICRMGWQKHIVAETTDVLEKLKSVAAAGTPGKGGGKGGVLVPATIDTTWLAELMLNLAFGLEDAGKDAEAAKLVDEAYKQYEDMLKQKPDAEAKDPRLRLLILNARAYFVRKQAAAPQTSVRSDIDKLRGSSLLGVALLVRNGGIPKETCEDELIKAWSNVDKDFNLAEAKEALIKDPTNVRADDRGANVEPVKLVDMSMALRAACAAECWTLARAMLARLEKSKMPPGRGRILLDLSKSEIEVWQARNLRQEDPTSKMLLPPEEQKKVEVQARTRGSRLCEQCIMAAKRIQEVDLVEDSAVTLWNITRELLCDGQRLLVHKSLHKCVEILDEIEPPRLARLRVQLHSEVAYCEISQDLLTKGCSELQNAEAIDYTAADSELSDVIKQRLVANDEGICQDPAPYIRRFDAPMHQQSDLLQWKLSLYEEPTDPVDQVMLLLDQVRQQSARKQSNAASVAFNLLNRGLNELETTLEDLVPDELQKLSRTFVPPPRMINSNAAMQPLPHQAPATVKDPENDTKAAPIQDSRPRSDYENAVLRVKRIIMLMCRISIEAYKIGQYEFAIKAARRAFSLVEGDIQFGPPPTEIEGAILLAEMSYAKALSLSKELEDVGVINGVDEEVRLEKPSDDTACEDGENLEPELDPEEQASTNAKKRELIEALVFGMEKSHEFKQYWLVSNGLAHWWNLHMELVELSHGQPEYLKRTLGEYRDGLRKMLKYFHGEAALPDSDFDHALVANLTLAHVNASVCAAQPQLDALEIDKLLVLKRLGGNERKEVMARVTELCKAKDKPIKPEDLAKIKLDRLEGASTGSDPKAKAKAAPKAEASPLEDRSDLQGREAEVVTLATSLPYAPNHDEGKKIVDQAVAVLNAWEPKQKDEVQLTLWIELWTRLGRQCLGKPLNSNVGSKYALMCGIKGLGGVDAPTPKFASVERQRWRGACHSLCGEVFIRLIDPQKQEKESVLKLRTMAVEQFERCCQYAIDTKSSTLAVFGAKNMWNVSLKLQHSAETRQILRKPLLTATRALAAVKYQEDPYFFVGFYSALFDCYSDSSQWDAVLEMLGEAFSAVPSICHRRLWALRMLALSKQGKNVVIAMGKMKESQAKAQAGIWLVLARASSKKTDQLDAYTNAVRILREAQQPDVVEVQMELADWMLRNGFDQKIAQEQLMSAAEVLLEIEDDIEEDGEDGFGEGGDGTASSYVSDRDQSVVSFRSSRRGGSDAGSSRRKSKGTRSFSKGRTTSRASSRGSDLKKRRSSRSSARSSKSANSKNSKKQKAEEDQELPEQLYSHNYEALIRIYAASSRLCTGGDAHSALLGAAHFAVSFFTVSIELANKAAQDLANMQLIEGDMQASLRSQTSQGLGKLVATGSKDLNKLNSPIVPPFLPPQQLADWADPEAWPWRGCPPITEVFSTATKKGILDGDTCTWAGHADVFAKPPLSFHALCRLEEDLEEHGYHLWAFPVLALHLHLANSFNSPIREAMSCLVFMRLSRFASECGLMKAARVAADKGREILVQIKDTFGSFSEELALVHSQRSGRGVGDSLDPDLIDEIVCAPWSCDELFIYQVWAEVSHECFLHGELLMGCKISEEAIHHSRVHGDRRTLRKLLITRSRLASSEGMHDDAASYLKDVTAADLEQTVQVAQILGNVYAAKRQPILADELFEGAIKVIKDSAKVAIGSDSHLPPVASFVRAECDVRASQLLAEISRLSLLSVTSRDWLEALDKVFAMQQNMMDQLHDCASYRRCIIVYLAFVDPMSQLLEGKRQELANNATLSIASGGFLSCKVLATYGACLCDLASRCRRSRDALLSTSVPIEGVKDGAVSPSEVLAAKLDIWEARAGSLHREFEAAARIEEDRKALVVEVARMSRASIVALPEICAGRTLQVGRAWPEEDTGVDPVEQFVTAWEEEQDKQIAESKRVVTVAKAATSVEQSIAMVSNAVTTLQSFSQKGVDSVEGSDQLHTACEIEALVELGRLQLERAKNMPMGTNLVPVGTPSKWEQPAPDPREMQGLQLGERYSNILQSKDPNELYKVPSDVSDALAAEPNNAESEESIVFEEIGKAVLCEGLNKALKTRRVVAARRALQALALDAYGAQFPEATFEFLIWLQSVDVCIRADEVLTELVSDDHQERVQLGLLRRLENTWLDPTQLHAYESTIKRLGRDSPFFQRICLADLPPINELLLSYLPPLTIVLTLQIHGDFLYVGAASTPEEGDPQKRVSQIRRMVTRMPVLASEVHAFLLKLNELNTSIEKELVNKPGLNEDHVKQFELLLSHLDSWIVKPIVKELTSSLWPWSTNIEHSSNPKQLVLMPDSTLWGFPLERCASLANLFSIMCHSALSRDISLHAAAYRVRRFVEPADGSARIPLKGSVAGFRLDSTSLLTDPFMEDVLKTSDDPKTETMSMLHDRLVHAKVVGHANRSFHGKMFTASPQDVKGILTDSTAFLSFGFSRFFVTMPAKHFASQDLRRLSLFGLFNRSINDPSFRRQTKIDSAKTLRQLAAESPYGMSLMASFRGVQSMIIVSAPVPIPLAMRNIEVFSRALQGGKTVGKALEDVLSQQIKDPSLRYLRAKEGGILPPEARSATAAADAKDTKKHTEQGDGKDREEYLLPLHTQAAYSMVGAPWLFSESGPEGGGKKGK